MNIKSLRILFIEDSENDVELVRAYLERSGYDIHLQQVETADVFSKALTDQTWDIILSDYSLPRFNAPKAYDILRKSKLDIPFIVVSGTIEGRTGVEMMKAGVQDFVLKNDFQRLLPSIEREVTEARFREKHRRDLEQSESKFKHLADSIPQMLWVSDSTGDLIYVNQGWYDYTGLSAEQTFGKGWTRVLHHDDTKGVIEAYNEALQEEKVYFSEHRIKSNDGSYRWFMARGVPIRDADNKISSWYGTWTDIHEQRLLLEELKNAKNQAESANQAKSVFLANMSHEIRTPLGAILGFAELMTNPQQSPSERQDCIMTIMRNGVQLSKVLNDILDLSKIELQKLDIEKVPFSLIEVIEDVMSLLRLKAQENDTLLVVNFVSLLPEKILSDPNRLRQILINIVGNAIKFTNQGQVSVRVSLMQPENKKNSPLIKFEIKDTGTGIASDKVGKLFQPFTQADSSMTRKFGGSGLGLSLSRNLARTLGGDLILAESTPGKGSTFVLTIDCGSLENLRAFSQDEIQKPKSLEPTEEDDQSKLHDKKILVVDDSPDNRVLVRHYLSHVGARVELAENGLIGMNLALENDYSVVLMDIQMPVMDGYKAVSMLREKGYKKPIVALTAHAMKGDREQCLRAGFDDHLSKPINRATLIETLKKATS